jgi:hypothetical protein
MEELGQFVARALIRTVRPEQIDETIAAEPAGARRAFANRSVADLRSRFRSHP